MDQRNVDGVAEHHPVVPEVAELHGKLAQAVEIVAIATPHATDRVADARGAGVDQHLRAEEQRLLPLGRPAEADRLVDVAEARDRTAHVRNPRRGSADLVREPDRGRGLEDRVDDDTPALEIELDLHAGEQRVDGMHVGRALDLGNQDAAEAGAHHRPQVLERLPGGPRLDAREEGLVRGDEEVERVVQGRWRGGEPGFGGA